MSNPTRRTRQQRNTYLFFFTSKIYALSAHFMCFCGIGCLVSHFLFKTKDLASFPNGFATKQKIPSNAAPNSICMVLWLASHLAAFYLTNFLRFGTQKYIFVL